MADREAVAILGGTGDQGLGLAYRFAAAGRPVRIGSRKEERALAAAEASRASRIPRRRTPSRGES
jgi:predicted dinucleotide-binding enzyme